MLLLTVSLILEIRTCTRCELSTNIFTYVLQNRKKTNISITTIAHYNALHSDIIYLKHWDIL